MKQTNIAVNKQCPVHVCMKDGKNGNDSEERGAVVWRLSEMMRKR